MSRNLTWVGGIDDENSPQIFQEIVTNQKIGAELFERVIITNHFFRMNC